jgi:hypothetical protein
MSSHLQSSGDYLAQKRSRKRPRGTQVHIGSIDAVAREYTLFATGTTGDTMRQSTPFRRDAYANDHPAYHF